ncbi:MAG: DUF5995 family protein [Gemmatimonadota bacterium]|jgi:hypothetical protein
MTPSTIDDVLERLEAEVALAERRGSRLGYFAALYHEVTAAVAAGIRDGRFEDGERMERLDVTFARRYLDALDAYRGGAPCTRSWRLAFDAAQQWSPLILQHLLLGMNAHIGLDLGIAAARTAPGRALPSLRADFDEITSLLGELVDEVQDRIARVSPWMWIVDRVGLRSDEETATFGLGASRRLAWKWAERLAELEPEDQEPAIESLDGVVAGIGKRIVRPGIHLRSALLLVRLREAPDVPRVIAALRGTGV